MVVKLATPLALVIATSVLTGCVTTYVTAGSEQILSTAELMELLMDPIHEDLKDVIENPPEKRADWRGLYVAAYTLAETNNLLYSRTDHGYMLQPEWRDRVTDARAVTVALADSIKAQEEYETIKESYLAVVENCNECHLRYDPTQMDAPRVDPPRPWDIEPEGGQSGTMTFH